MKPTLVILDNEYPSPTHLYADGFVHSRVLTYLDRYECVVCSLTRTNDYVYEGVVVKAFPSPEEIVAFVQGLQPAVVLAHFAEQPMLDQVLQKLTCPAILWAHGYEVISWRRRWFNFGPRSWLTLLPIIRAASKSRLQLGSYRKFVIDRSPQMVFVSEWLKRVSSNDLSIPSQTAAVIPNPIKTDVFHYRQKVPSDRLNVLVIRPFTARNYATDVVTQTIERLSREPEFERITFRIFGDGPRYEDCKRRLTAFANVKMEKRFLTHEEIVLQHAWAGIFLYPTRQDSQGVSLCEAMSSGLVPVTNRVAAIPEFVTHNISGRVATSMKGIADELLAVVRDQALFLRLSEAAAKSIRKKAGHDVIAEKEISLIERVIGVK